LLIKSKSEIHAIDLTTLDTTVIIGGIAGRTMDIDTVDNKLYIADNNSISRVNLDDMCVEVILQNVSVRDMAIDWLARRLFWTEYLEKQIFVADLGDKKKSVFIKRTSYPSGIAFDATVK
jgi:DNA-binding beta-propeller fold protein YncE